MKKRTALKDCFWSVYVSKEGGWVAATLDHTGSDETIRTQCFHSRTIASWKQNWKSYAKLNGWNNWEFV